MTPIELILSRLPQAKCAGKGWTARCPAHDDRRASLSVGAGDERHKPGPEPEARNQAVACPARSRSNDSRHDRERGQEGWIRLANVISDPNGRNRLQFVAGDGTRTTIRMGKATVGQAEAIKVRVEQLALAATGASGVVDGETVKWLGGLDDVVYDKLAAVGLVGRRESTRLGASRDDYIRGRHDVKAGTTTV